MADHNRIEALNDQLRDVFQDSEDHCDKRLHNGDLLPEQLLSLVLHFFVFLGDLIPYLFLIFLVFLILLQVVFSEDELHSLLFLSFCVFCQEFEFASIVVLFVFILVQPVVESMGAFEPLYILNVLVILLVQASVNYPLEVSVELQNHDLLFSRIFVLRNDHLLVWVHERVV